MLIISVLVVYYNEGKVVPAKVPQPPVKRMQDGKVVAPKVPRPTPAPSKK